MKSRCCRVSANAAVVDVAVELGEARIGADRLLHRPLRCCAIEAREILLVVQRSQPLDLQSDFIMLGGRGLVGGIETHRLCVVLQCAIAIALAAPGRAAVVPGALELRIESQRRIIIGDRTAVVLLSLIRIAAIGQEIRITGTQLDRFVVVGDRPGIVAIGCEMQTAIVKEFWPGRVDPDRGSVIVQRPIGAADLAVGGTAIGVGSRILRLQADGLVVVGDRLLVLALEIPGRATIGKSLREIRFQPERLLVVLMARSYFLVLLKVLPRLSYALALSGSSLMASLNASKAASNLPVCR